MEGVRIIESAAAYSRRRRKLGRGAALFSALIAAALLTADVAFAATTIPMTTYTQNAIWTAAASPYVIDGDVTVGSGATLTIEPGVIVKFAYRFAVPKKIVIASGGVLRAAGTFDNPITFTSIKDDAVGGDTGGDGPTSCVASDGGYIESQSASPLNLITKAAFRCGPYGQGKTDAPVRVTGAGSALTVTDAEVSGLHGSAFYVAGGTLTLARVNITNPASVGVMVGFEGDAGIEDAAIVGTNANGNGVRVEDGTVTVKRSTLRNLEFGVVVLLSPTTAATASSFTSNTIRDNNYGVYVSNQYGTNSFPPVSKLPYGHFNNVYNNGGSAPDKRQLSAGSSTSAGSDWSNNYWGPDVFPRANPGVCTDWGYLAYPTATPGGPKSPANWQLYVGGTFPGEYCTKNWYDFGGPAGFSQVPFGFEPFLSAGATLGGAGSPWIKDVTGRASDPVATASGNFVHQRVDLRLAGIGVPFRLVRTYNSLDGLGGSLGPGWTHNLAASLRIGNGGDVTARTDDGAQLPFTKNGDGSFAPAPGIRATLEAVGGGYRLTRHDQLRYEFDSAGRLLSVRDRNGQGLTLGYTSGNLTSATDSAGRVVAFAYDAGNRLGSVTLPGGRNVAYTYNASGRLATVTDARGKTWSYTYDGNGLLSKETNPVGQQVFRNVYDPTTSRVVEQYDGLENKTAFAWNAATQTAAVTDARGKQWIDRYAHNLLVSRTNPLNQTTTFTHDANANVTSITDPRGKR